MTPAPSSPQPQLRGGSRGASGGARSAGHAPRQPASTQDAVDNPPPFTRTTFHKHMAGMIREIKKAPSADHPSFIRKWLDGGEAMAHHPGLYRTIDDWKRKPLRWQLADAEGPAIEPSQPLSPAGALMGTPVVPPAEPPVAPLDGVMPRGTRTPVPSERPSPPKKRLRPGDGLEDDGSSPDCRQQVPPRTAKRPRSTRPSTPASPTSTRSPGCGRWVARSVRCAHPGAAGTEQHRPYTAQLHQG